MCAVYLHNKTSFSQSISLIGYSKYSKWLCDVCSWQHNIYQRCSFERLDCSPHCRTYTVIQRLCRLFGEHLPQVLSINLILLIQGESIWQNEMRRADIVANGGFLKTPNFGLFSTIGKVCYDSF